MMKVERCSSQIKCYDIKFMNLIVMASIVAIVVANALQYVFTIDSHVEYVFKGISVSVDVPTVPCVPTLPLPTPMPALSAFLLL